MCTATPSARPGAGHAPRSLLDRQRLAVTFLVPDPDQDLSTDDDRPFLFGQPFDGPMRGHEPGMPAHDDLHVWTHEAPDGLFATWNPRVSC
ncbi:MAG: hypothetical protein M3P93_07050 [Actinomycetota bacterium]|nr:hypothetical protein [Actinomycetota bacterium]